MKSFLKLMAWGKKPPIQTEMVKLQYIDLKKSYKICHGTVCWINQSESLFFIYEEINALNQFIYRIGYVYDDIDFTKEQTFNAISYKMKSHTWQLQIVQSISRKQNYINIYLPASLDSDMNIIFDSDELADKWYVLLVNSQICEKQRNKKIERELNKEKDRQQSVYLKNSIELSLLDKQNVNKQSIPLKDTSKLNTQCSPNEQIQSSFLQKVEVIDNEIGLTQPFRQSSYGQIVSNALNQPIPEEILNWLNQQTLK